MINLKTVEIRKLSDERAIALTLQCLYAAAGEGVSCPVIARFCSVQSAQGFSKHRSEKLTRDLVAGGWITVKVDSRNGRKTYHLELYGLIMLAAYTKHLPITSRDLMKAELQTLIEDARAKLVIARGELQ